jgi:serine/threonine protein kinase
LLCVQLHETPVAVKVLLDLEEAQAAEPEAVWSLSNPILSNLRKESSLMASLQHPNIVQFMGVCTRPPAMITEYCSRGSLAEVLKGAKIRPDKLRALTWTRRLAMALDAAKGMLYLHESGVVHRDLKSPNLLVDKSWKVKVAGVCHQRYLPVRPAALSVPGRHVSHLPLSPQNRTTHSLHPPHSRRLQPVQDSGHRYRQRAQRTCKYEPTLAGACLQLAGCCARV